MPPKARSSNHGGGRAHAGSRGKGGKCNCPSCRSELQGEYELLNTVPHVTALKVVCLDAVIAAPTVNCLVMLPDLQPLGEIGLVMEDAETAEFFQPFIDGRDFHRVVEVLVVIADTNDTPDHESDVIIVGARSTTSRISNNSLTNKRQQVATE